MNETALNPQAQIPGTADSIALDLRDIHLPDPISWWPIAPGWWIIISAIILIAIIFFISRKIYLNRQLNRDISAELETIKKQFTATQDKSQLAKALSILLRRANISYYPKEDTAGLIGNDWLAYLDKTNSGSSSKKAFQSEIGKILLSAPYLPAETQLDYDATTLISICESWLLTSHKKSSRGRNS